MFKDMGHDTHTTYIYYNIDEENYWIANSPTRTLCDVGVLYIYGYNGNPPITVYI